jgi:iron(III) transport system ATP-binding protein
VREGAATVRLPCRLGEGLGEGASAVLSVRPENVQALPEEPGEPRLEGRVLQTIFLGNCLDCRVRWGAFEWKILAHPRQRLQPGDRVFLRLDPEHSLAVRP